MTRTSSAATGRLDADGAAPEASRSPLLRTTNTMPPSQLLQVALVWQDKILAYKLVRPRERVTLGPSHRASLNTPRVQSSRRRPSDRHALLVPRKPRGSYRLRLTEDLRGEVTVAGQRHDVAEVLRTGRPARRDPAVRELDLSPGDRARLYFHDVPALRIEVRFVEPPRQVPRMRLVDAEPFLARTVAATSAAMAIFLAALLLFAPNEEPRPLAISKERMAKLVPPAPPPLAPPPERGAEKKAEDKVTPNAGETKRAERERGRVGKSDAVAKETIVPKGEQDVLRDKVSKVGLLGLIGKERPQGSGLAKLFANNSMELEQAVAGMTGAHAVVAGRGAGGLSTSGAGPGGGGTGAGHLYGAGALDTGGHASHGRGHGPALVSREEREVKLDIAAGTLDEGGGLTKEQVARVVRAHSNAIKFCYEKELQRKPTLAGKIEIYWVIGPDGVVEKSRIAVTTMADGAVEGCVARQVKQWIFPKSDGRTVVQSYPFLFKGGV
jgi:hypothetical protein